MSNIFRRVFSTVIALAIVLNTSAQSDAVRIMTEVNRHIQTIKQGCFETKGYWRSATRNDTLIDTGRTCFFRESVENGDSIAPFILFKGEKIKEAFDGNNYYFILDEQKYIDIEAPESRGAFGR
jgi:hypothetical protein